MCRRLILKRILVRIFEIVNFQINVQLGPVEVIAVKQLDILYNKGAEGKACFSVTHGILLPSALEALDSDDRIEKLVVTNTIPVPPEKRHPKIEVLSIAPLLAGIIQDIHDAKSISNKLVLKIGIHTGHSIVVTLNDRLDYFGQTVNIASRVQELADAGEIYVSQEVYNSLGVREAVAHCQVEHEHVAMKGISEKLQVYKISMQA